MLLCRHGESQANASRVRQGRADYPLSSLGVRQAQALAQRLVREDMRLAAIYTSTRVRALHTAEGVADVADCSLVRDARLQERDLGVLTGLTLEQARRLHGGELAQAEQDGDVFDGATGAESAEALRRRVRGVLTEITTRHRDDGVVLVVSHGGTLNACLAELLHSRSRPLSL